ncbi:hypothetical protein [Streptacidiphilus anmyonensis]|uniref:hypothetical protein n=1 Tax=Streptacidiphilus anmyonensis TaxID=405782 RepID=UPI001364C370|nr:hypothetical protein [Streptacidiphilus anmyonensis]
MPEAPGQSFTENPLEAGVEAVDGVFGALRADAADEADAAPPRSALEALEAPDGRVTEAAPDPPPSADDTGAGCTGSAEARASHGVCDDSCDGRSLGRPGSTYVGASVVRTAGPVLSPDAPPVAPGVGGHAVREAGIPASTGTAVLRMPHPLSVTATIAATTAAASAAVAAWPRRRSVRGPGPPGASLPGTGPPPWALSAPAVTTPAVTTPAVTTPSGATLPVRVLSVTAPVLTDRLTVRLRWVVLIACCRP